MRENSIIWGPTVSRALPEPPNRLEYNMPGFHVSRPWKSDLTSLYTEAVRISEIVVQSEWITIIWGGTVWGRLRGQA